MEEMKFAGKFCSSSLAMNTPRHVWFRFYGVAEVVGFAGIRESRNYCKVWSRDVNKLKMYEGIKKVYVTFSFLFALL